MTNFFVPSNIVQSNWIIQGTDLIEIDITKRVLVEMSTTTDIISNCSMIVKSDLGILSHTPGNLIRLHIDNSNAYISSETTNGGASYLPLSILVAGNNCAYFSTTGNVGFGTATPAAIVEVNTSGDGWALYAGNNGGAKLGVWTGTYSAVVSTIVTAVSSPNLYIGIGSNTPSTYIKLTTSNTISLVASAGITANTVTIDTSGNVVCSTLTCNSGNVIISGNNAGVLVESSTVTLAFIANTSSISSTYLGTTTNSSFGIRTNNNIVAGFFVSGNFQVSSSTTDQGYNFYVTGTARITSDVTSDGKFISNGASIKGKGLSIDGALSDPASCAVAQFISTTKGVLFPVMTTSQKNAIGSPTAGLVIYDSTLGKLCHYSGSAWLTITSA